MLVINFKKNRFAWNNVVSYVQILVNMGIDPADENSDNETLLEKLLASACKMSEQNDFNTNTYNRIIALVECARLLAPALKGLQKENSNLLFHLHKLQFHISHKSTLLKWYWTLPVDYGQWCSSHWFLSPKVTKWAFAGVSISNHTLQQAYVYWKQIHVHRTCSMAMLPTGRSHHW